MKWAILILLFLQATQPQDKEAAANIREGNRLYKSNKMAEAAEAYDKAINSKYKYEALMNKGNALYKQKKYEDAIKTYNAAASPANTDVLLRSGAYYNAGVVYSNQKKIQQSIEEYKNALRLNWQDAKARENLQKALSELKQSGGGGSSKQDQAQQKSKPSINQNRAQQQLDKLEEKEKNTQSRVSGKKSQYGGSAGKDW